MDEKIDAAMEKVLGLVRVNMTPDEVQKVTQAAQNMAHVKQIWATINLAHAELVQASINVSPKKKLNES